MNLKKAKRLRGHVRMLMGMDPRHAVYAAPTFREGWLPVPGLLNPDGTQKKVAFQIINPVRLLPCGRKRYQMLKRAVSA